MGRVSAKKNKTQYQLFREELGYSRAKASDLLGWITEDRIYKIETGKSVPDPKEVLAMATVYKKPRLCNHHCANECPIGIEYVPEISVKELSQIVLEMLSSLNSAQKHKDRLIEIAADGKISSDEIADFVRIQEELERISVTVETLRLWSERMLATGAIDVNAYKAYKEHFSP